MVMPMALVPTRQITVDRVLGSSVLSELRAKPLAAYAADYKPLLSITQQLLCPVYAATLNKLQSPPGSGCGVDVKTEVEIVPAAAGSMFVECTIYALKLRSNCRQKLGLDQFHTRI